MIIHVLDALVIHSSYNLWYNVMSVLKLYKNDVSLPGNAIGSDSDYIVKHITGFWLCVYMIYDLYQHTHCNVSLKFQYNIRMRR